MSNLLHILNEYMVEHHIDVAFITDDGSVYYFTGYYDYLHVEFGWPTILEIGCNTTTLLITPVVDYNSALDNAHVDKIVAWDDGDGDEWREKLYQAVKAKSNIVIEVNHIPQPVKAYIQKLNDDAHIQDSYT